MHRLDKLLLILSLFLGLECNAHNLELHVEAEKQGVEKRFLINGGNPKEHHIDGHSSNHIFRDFILQNDEIFHKTFLNAHAIEHHLHAGFAKGVASFELEKKGDHKIKIIFQEENKAKIEWRQSPMSGALPPVLKTTLVYTIDNGKGVICDHNVVSEVHLIPDLCLYSESKKLFNDNAKQERRAYHARGVGEQIFYPGHGAIVSFQPVIRYKNESYTYQIQELPKFKLTTDKVIYFHRWIGKDKNGDTVSKVYVSPLTKLPVDANGVVSATEVVGLPETFHVYVTPSDPRTHKNQEQMATIKVLPYDPYGPDEPEDPEDPEEDTPPYPNVPYVIDLDIDSDNSGSIDGSDLEDTLETLSSEIGKVLLANNDADNTVHGYAADFKFKNKPDLDNKALTIADSRLVELKLDFRKFLISGGAPSDNFNLATFEKVKVNFNYSSSAPQIVYDERVIDPAKVDGASEFLYGKQVGGEWQQLPSGGCFRIWTRNNQTKLGDPIDKGGDYVPPGKEILLVDLLKSQHGGGATLSNKELFDAFIAEKGSVILFLEGVRPTEGSKVISVKVERPDDFGGYIGLVSKDSVRAFVANLDLDTDSDNSIGKKFLIGTLHQDKIESFSPEARIIAVDRRKNEQGADSRESGIEGRYTPLDGNFFGWTLDSNIPKAYHKDVTIQFIYDGFDPLQPLDRTPHEAKNLIRIWKKDQSVDRRARGNVYGPSDYIEPNRKIPYDELFGATGDFATTSSIKLFIEAIQGDGSIGKISVKFFYKGLELPYSYANKGGVDETNYRVLEGHLDLDIDSDNSDLNREYGDDPVEDKIEESSPGKIMIANWECQFGVPGYALVSGGYEGDYQTDGLDNGQFLYPVYVRIPNLFPEDLERVNLYFDYLLSHPDEIERRKRTDHNTKEGTSSYDYSANSTTGERLWMPNKDSKKFKLITPGMGVPNKNVKWVKDNYGYHALFYLEGVNPSFTTRKVSCKVGINGINLADDVVSYTVIALDLAIDSNNNGKVEFSPAEDASESGENAGVKVPVYENYKTDEYHRVPARYEGLVTSLVTSDADEESDMDATYGKFEKLYMKVLASGINQNNIFVKLNYSGRNVWSKGDYYRLRNSYDRLYEGQRNYHDPVGPWQTSNNHNPTDRAQIIENISGYIQFIEKDEKHLRVWSRPRRLKNVHGANFYLTRSTIGFDNDPTYGHYLHPEKLIPLVAFQDKNRMGHLPEDEDTYALYIEGSKLDEERKQDIEAEIYYWDEASRKHIYLGSPDIVSTKLYEFERTRKPFEGLSGGAKRIKFKTTADLASRYEAETNEIQYYIDRWIDRSLHFFKLHAKTYKHLPKFDDFASLGEHWVNVSVKQGHDLTDINEIKFVENSEKLIKQALANRGVSTVEEFNALVNTIKLKNSSDWTEEERSIIKEQYVIEYYERVALGYQLAALQDGFSLWQVTREDGTRYWVTKSEAMLSKESPGYDWEEHKFLNSVAAYYTLMYQAVTGVAELGVDIGNFIVVKGKVKYIEVKAFAHFLHQRQLGQLTGEEKKTYEENYNELYWEFIVEKEYAKHLEDIENKKYVALEKLEKEKLESKVHLEEWGYTVYSNEQNAYSQVELGNRIRINASIAVQFLDIGALGVGSQIVNTKLMALRNSKRLKVQPKDAPTINTHRQAKQMQVGRDGRYSAGAKKPKNAIEFKWADDVPYKLEFKKLEQSNSYTVKKYRPNQRNGSDPTEQPRPPRDWPVGGGCFVAGTQVHTPQGLKNIEDIKVGDRVLSSHETTGAMGYKKVTRTFITHPNELIQLDIKVSTSDALQEIKGTFGHRIWSVDRGQWVEMGTFALNEKLRLANGSTAHVVKRQSFKTVKPTKPFVTYNFTVDDYSTYYIGKQGIWVHNVAGPCQDPLYISILKKNDLDHHKSLTEYLQQVKGNVNDEYHTLIEKFLKENPGKPNRENWADLYTDEFDKFVDLALENTKLDVKGIKEAYTALAFEERTGISLVRPKNSGKEADFVQKNDPSLKYDAVGPGRSQFDPNLGKFIISIKRHIEERSKKGIPLIDIRVHTASEKTLVKNAIFDKYPSLEEGVDYYIFE